jgi:hypothetical protein
MAGHRASCSITPTSRKPRAALIQAAGKRGLPVRCVWLATSVEDAQVNADADDREFGRLLGPDESADGQARRQRLRSLGAVPLPA